MGFGTAIRISTSIGDDSSRGDICGTAACSSSGRARDSVRSRPLSYRDGAAGCCPLPAAAAGLPGPRVPLMLNVHGELAADAVEKQVVGWPSKPS